MLAVAIVLTFFPFACAVVGAVSILLRLGESRQRRILERTPALPLAQWTPGARQAVATTTTGSSFDPRLLRERRPTELDPVITETTSREVKRENLADVPAVVSRQSIQDLRRHETLRLIEIRLPAGRQPHALDAGMAHGPETMFTGR